MNFWSHVKHWAKIVKEEMVFVLNLSCKTEIDKFNILFIFCKHDILKFDVSVNDFVYMAVLDSAN